MLGKRDFLEPYMEQATSPPGHVQRAISARLTVRQLATQTGSSLHTLPAQVAIIIFLVSRSPARHDLDLHNALAQRSWCHGTEMVWEGCGAARGIELRSVIFGVLMILFTEFTVGVKVRRFASLSLCPFRECFGKDQPTESTAVAAPYGSPLP